NRQRPLTTQASKPALPRRIAGFQPCNPHRLTRETPPATRHPSPATPTHNTRAPTRDTPLSSLETLLDSHTIVALPHMSSLTISVRSAGRRKPLVPDWQLPWPPDERSDGEPLTLRQL